MALDLVRLRAKLKAKGYFVADDPAHPGTGAYIALFAFAAGHPPTAAITAIGAAATRYFADYAMDRCNRVAEFVAQTAHETGGYAAFEENLNYSAQALANTWPGRFAVDPHAPRKQANAKAVALAHHQEAIANIVYNRPKEGNDAPGDGWRYRGRGMLQLTFKNGYRAAGARLGVDLVAHPERAADPALSLRIALDFWQRCAANDCCDADDFYGARGLTNCGTRTPAAPPIGLADVAARRARLLPMLG